MRKLISKNNFIFQKTFEPSSPKLFPQKKISVKTVFLYNTSHKVQIPFGPILLYLIESLLNK